MDESGGEWWYWGGCGEEDECEGGVRGTTGHWAEDMGGFWESWRGDRGDLIGWMVEGDGDLSLFRVVLVMSVLTTVEESASDCLWTWNEFCDEACSEAD